MQGAVIQAAPLALPIQATEPVLCDWCDRVAVTAQDRKCPVCIAKFGAAMEAEQDFRARLAAHAEALIAEWTRDWATHPAFAEADVHEMLASGLDVITLFAPEGHSLAPVQAAQQAAWNQARGVAQ